MTYRHLAKRLLRRASFGFSLPEWLRRHVSDDIDAHIARRLHCRQVRHFRVHSKDLPHYRFVDLYRAAEAFCQEPLTLCHDDFRVAIQEMRRFSEGTTGRIIGFHDTMHEPN